MEEQETAEKPRIIVELKMDAAEVIRLTAEVNLLERKIDLLKREIHKLTGSMLNKQEKARLNDEEKRELGVFVRQPEINRQVSQSLISEAIEIDSRLKVIGIENATCFFDNPQNLQVTVTYPSQPGVTIDLIKSIRADVRNIGHPLVVEAIRRYLLVITRASSRQARQNPSSDTSQRMKPSIAKANLDRLFRAVVASAEPATGKTERQNYYDFLFASNRLSADYFETLWGILHDPAIKKLRRGGTKLESIKRRLLEHYPERDHQDVLEYLGSVLSDKPEGKLPKRGGGEALQNAFLGWKHKISPKTAKEYVSKGQRSLRDSLPPDYDYRKLFDFSADETDGIVEDFLLTYLGIKDIKPYEDLSKLVKVETSPEPDDDKN